MPTSIIAIKGSGGLVFFFESEKKMRALQFSERPIIVFLLSNNNTYDSILRYHFKNLYVCTTIVEFSLGGIQKPRGQQGGRGVSQKATKGHVWGEGVHQKATWPK